MTLQQRFKEWVDKIGIPEAAKLMKTDPETVIKLSSTLSLKGANWFFSNVIEDELGKVVASEDPPDVPEAPASKAPDHVAEWEGKRLAILFPSYKFTNAATAWCLSAFALDIGKDKLRMDMELGDAAIDNARNRLATRFLETECEWSLWIDDDMIVPIGRAAWFKQICRLPKSYPDSLAGLHTIQRLLSHGKKIVGGCYFGRQRTGNPMFGEATVNPMAMDVARSMTPTLVRTPWVATGCLLVHRSVYEDIQKKFPDLAPKGAGRPWNFFKMTDGDVGEDVIFCRRAREAGHEVFVDTGLQCGHVGWNVFNATNTGQKE